MMATAVGRDGVRLRDTSREMVEWLTPVRMASTRCETPRLGMASRTQPPKSPSATRAGRRSPSAASPLVEPDGLRAGQQAM